VLPRFFRNFRFFRVISSSAHLLIEVISSFQGVFHILHSFQGLPDKIFIFLFMQRSDHSNQRNIETSKDGLICRWSHFEVQNLVFIVTLSSGILVSISPHNSIFNFPKQGVILVQHSSEFGHFSSVFLSLIVDFVINSLQRFNFRGRLHQEFEVLIVEEF